MLDETLRQSADTRQMHRLVAQHDQNQQRYHEGQDGAAAEHRQSGDLRPAHRLGQPVAAADQQAGGAQQQQEIAVALGADRPVRLDEPGLVAGRDLAALDDDIGGDGKGGEGHDQHHQREGAVHPEGGGEHQDMVEHQVDQENLVRPFGAFGFFGRHVELLVHFATPMAETGA